MRGYVAIALVGLFSACAGESNEDSPGDSAQEEGGRGGEVVSTPASGELSPTTQGGNAELRQQGTRASAPPCSGIVLVGADGTFLGAATSNQFSTQGLCNSFSQYGSRFSSTSIFNRFSDYGSQFSALSAYNPFATTPPVLYCPAEGFLLNPVSKNRALQDAIDPDSLCSLLLSIGI